MYLVSFELFFRSLSTSVCGCVNHVLVLVIGSNIEHEKIE